MSDVLTENGLPVEAQPWARHVERFIRDQEILQQQLAGNTETAFVASGNAVLAAANSVQAQLAAQYEMARIPATLQASDVTVTPSTYFDSNGTPHGHLDVSVMPSDLDIDGNPLIPVAYQVWARVFFVDPGIPVDDKTTLGYGPPYQMLGMSPSTNIPVDGLQVGVQYQIRVCAVSSFGVSSFLSGYITVTTPNTLAVMAAPSAPTLATGSGMLSATWDGNLGGALPASQFRSLYAEVSVSGANSWQRMGSPLVRGGGSIQISKLTVGTSYDVHFIAVDSLGVTTPPSPTSTITLAGVDLTGLAQNVNDAIAAAQAAGVAGQAAASAAQTKANSASADAATAQSAANGKNTVTFSELDASGTTGHVEGDLWFKAAGTVIIAQWQFASGAWASRTIDSEVIASLDAGKITSGFISSDRIDVGTILVGMLAAGSVTTDNLTAGSVAAANLQAGSVAAASLQAGSVTTSALQAGSVTTNVLAAGAVQADNIAAGAIQVNKLSPTFGKDLDISANGTVSIIAGQAKTAGDTANTNAAKLGQMQTVYAFGPTGATVSDPTSNTQLVLAAGQIQINQNGQTVSYWNAGQMFVHSFVGDEVVLGNHKLEKLGTGTVVRAL